MTARQRRPGRSERVCAVMLCDGVHAADRSLDGNRRAGDGIITAQAIEIDRQPLASGDRDQFEILRRRLGARRNAGCFDSGLRRRMVLALVSMCTRPSNSQQERKEGVGGTNDGNAHERIPHGPDGRPGRATGRLSRAARRAWTT
jgi:hypothetical protein